jgi:hypothetical protein
MVLVMKPPSGAGALLRKNGLQEKRATRATFSSLLLQQPTSVNWRIARLVRGHSGTLAQARFARIASVTEARLEDAGSGLAPATEGWFVVEQGEPA